MALINLLAGLLCLAAAAAAAAANQAQGQLHAPPCPRALNLNTATEFAGALHFVCLEAPHLKAPEPPRLQVVRYGGAHLKPQLVAQTQVHALNLSAANHMASFTDQHGVLRVLLADSSRLNGTSMYSLAPQSAAFSEEANTINSQSVASMTIWRLELNLEWQLAIAQQPAYRWPPTAGGANQPVKPSILSLFSWRSTYFDKYQILELPHLGHVNRIEPFQVNGQSFLVLALEPMPHQLQPAHSLLYKLDFGDSQLHWTLYQLLPTRLALDARSFAISHGNSLRKDYYFALLGELEQHSTAQELGARQDSYGLAIFKYFGDEFKRVHFLEAPGATRLDALAHGYTAGDSQVILALLSELDHQLSIFAYDGSQLRQLAKPQSPASSGAPHKRSELPNFHLFLAPTSNNDTLLQRRTLQPEVAAQPALTFSSVAPDNSTRDSVYLIPVDKEEEEEASTTTKRDQIPDLSNLTSWCQATLNSLLLDNFQESLMGLRPTLGFVPHKPIELFGNLVLEDDLQVSNLLYAPALTDLNNAPLSAHQAPLNFSSVYADALQVHGELDRVQHTVSQILVDDGSEQVVARPVAFEHLVLPCTKTVNANPAAPTTTKHRLSITCPHVQHIHTTLLNQHNVTTLERQAFLNSSSATINEDIRFDHLVLRGEVQILNRLNGIDIEDIVFKRGPTSNAAVIGLKVFHQGLFSSSDLFVDRWLGRLVNADNYLVSRADQRIESPLFLQQLILASPRSVKRINKLNGFNLDLHLNQVSLADANNTFHLPLEIDQLFLNGPIHFKTPHSHLNGINMDDLWLNTLFKQTVQNVTGHLEFAGHVHVSFAGDLQVQGPINGLYLNASNVLMRNRDYNFTQPVVFHDDLSVHQLELSMDLNGVQVAYNQETKHNELAILYNDRPQLLSADKILDKVFLGGQSHLHGHINGHINLTHLFKTVANHNNGYRFAQVTLSGDIRQPSNVPVTFNFVNDIEHPVLCDTANRILETSQELRFRGMQFRHPVQFNQLRCASINGFSNLTNFFLTKRGDQRVAGTLRLVEGVTFNSSLQIINSLNQLDIRPLSYAVSKALNETRTGHREVFGDFNIDDLMVSRINDLHLADVFFAKSDRAQLVRAPMVFDQLSIENILNVRANMNTAFFNQLNVSNILHNTLHYDQPQVIHNQLELSTLQILPGSNLATGLVNNFNLRRLYEDAVLVDVPQQIPAPKIFRGQVDMNRVSTVHGIDHLNTQQLNLNLLLFGDELIEDLEFGVDVVVKKELEIFTGMINGFSVNNYAKTMNGNDSFRRITSSDGVFKTIILNDLVRGGTFDRLPPLFLYNTRPAERPANQPIFHYLAPVNGSWAPPQAGFWWRPAQVLTPVNLKLIPYQPWNPAFEPLPQPQPSVYPVAKAQDPRLSLLVPQLPVKWIEPVEMTRTSSPEDVMRLQAIKELSTRINKYLAVSFFYEITQKQPSFGPVLHAAQDPSLNEHGRSLLLLKSTSRPGEPCLNWGQTIAVATQKVHRGSVSGFTQSALIQETNNPTLVDSLAVDKNHFLFVLDTGVDALMYLSSQVFVYSWDYTLGMYQLTERILVDGFPTALRSFVFRNRACFLLASPQVMQANHSGAPVMYCQSNPLSGFDLRTVIPLSDVFELDVITTSSQVLLATLSQQRNIEQIGELGVYSLDRDTGSLNALLFRRSVRPLKLHLFRGSEANAINLVVSEALTSNSAHRAATRIFRYQQPAVPVGAYNNRTLVLPRGRFKELQVIEEAEVADIQTVRLEAGSNGRSLIMLQSVHSIAIYAPLKAPANDPSCGQWALLQRLPTRGANKFLAFNDLSAAGPIGDQVVGHFLILSKDNCQQQQKYSTLVLRARFT